MKIAIVGAGAIGGYYGARLLAAGEDVRFLLRSDLETVRRDGLRVTSPDGDLHLRDVPAAGSTAEIGPVDLVIIAVKTTANEALPDLLPPLLHPGTMLLTLQNGLGNEEFLARHFGVDRILGGLCFVCLTRTAPGVIEHYGHGVVVMGEMGRPVSDRLRDVCGRFQRAGVDCRTVEDLAWERWRKLVWNVPFNGLSIAAGRATVEDLLADRRLEDEVRALMAEVISLAGALGFQIPLTVIDKEIARSRVMGPYRPSSLIDFERGLPVEVESIWGEPVRQAREAGHPVPKMELLHALLCRVTRYPVG